MRDNVIEFTILGKDELTQVLKAGTAAFAAFSAAVAFASKAIVDVGAENEKMQVRMNALLGSVAEGNKVFDDMATFASKVPFAYDEIMQSATTLSGVLRGGSDEISSMMPMIADLAAVSGLSIQETTDQIVRMYSAGAGAADLFRERGITAMLGFKAGVSVTAEETMQRVIASYESADSKFRGAANELGTTWDGILSMIGDKYRAMKVVIADAGLFNFFKAFAIEFDNLMGDALANTQENGKVWANFFIDSIRSVVDAVSVMADAWRGLEFVFIGLQVVFAKVAEFIFEGITKLANGVINIANLIPGIDIGKFDALAGAIQRSKERTAELNAELTELVNKKPPSEDIKSFMASVETTFAILQEETEKSKNAQINAQKAITTATLFELNERIVDEIEANDKKLENLTTYSESYAEIFDLTMARVFENTQTLGESVSGIIASVYDNLTRSIGRGVADAIVEGKKLSDVFSGILKSIAKQIIAMFIEMGIKRAAMSLIFGAASAKEASAALAGGFAQTYTNAFASTAAIPIVGPSLAPGVAAASLVAVQAGSAAAIAVGAGMGSAVGAAHGGLDYVPSESTFLLNKGERVLSPNQNKDLTDFLAGGGSGQGVVIENIDISISVDSLADMSREDLEQFLSDRVIPALDVLDRSGIRQEALERSAI